jgi:hypothetical protein
LRFYDAGQGDELALYFSTQRRVRPQRLMPPEFCCLCGAAEAAPFRSIVYSMISRV